MTRLTTLAIALTAGVACAGSAFAQTAQPAPTQQNRMAACNTEAKTKDLSGDARKAFMSSCLSGATAQPAVPPAPAKPVAAAPATQPAKPVPATAAAPAPAKPATAAAAPARPAAQAAPAVTAGNRVSVNNASADQLDALWGVGKVRAAAIIANRPYKSIDDFHAKHVVPENVFERIKDQLSL